MSRLEYAFQPSYNRESNRIDQCLEVRYDLVILFAPHMSAVCDFCGTSQIFIRMEMCGSFYLCHVFSFAMKIFYSLDLAKYRVSRP